jgi:ABC-type transporter Mla subunit MlaD
MRLPVPGPRDVLSVLERGAGSVEQLLVAVPRMLTLIGDAERLLARADTLLDDIDRTRAHADAVVAKTETVVDRANVLVAGTAPLTDRLGALLDAMEPSLVRLQPTLDRLAETTDPHEVDALVALVDQLPRLSEKLETDIMPILDSLNSVAPDLHDLLDVSRELNSMLSQVPGLSRMKARIDQQQAEEGRG